MEKKKDKEDTRNKIGDLEKRILDLEKKAIERDEYYDKYMRALAEHDNARKRIEKDTAEFVKFANESILRELFPILDSFDTAIASMDKTEKDRTLLDGLKLLQKKFHKVLEDNGLSLMTSIGGKFDPIKHEAVMKIHSDKHEDGTVVEELRKGYMLNGKVLRPAMVKVAMREEEEEKGNRE